MKVSAGTYNVTVSADGYETVQGQIVVDRSMCPEGSSEIIYKFSMENGFTGVQQADAVETLDIRNEGKQIVIDSETDCRAQIYTLSGVCVTHLQGKNIRSEALAPGTKAPAPPGPWKSAPPDQASPPEGPPPGRAAPSGEAGEVSGSEEDGLAAGSCPAGLTSGAANASASGDCRPKKSPLL